MTTSAPSAPAHLMGDGTTDNAAALNRYCEALAATRGTLTIPDGEYGIGSTIILPQGVGLSMSNGATLKALPEFAGEAMIETAPYRSKDKTRPDWAPQVIEGGTLDGSSLPITGIRTIRDRETDIRNIAVVNCLRKGLHLGVEGDCETNCFNVRIQCERGVFAEADSIGIHYETSTDNLVCAATIIGYATGLRSDTSSNDFAQVHVWNYDENCKLKYCFHCNGWNDSYSQCYADSPMNGNEEGYGFYVTQRFNRIVASRVYGNQWVVPGKVTGIYIAESGTHGSYLGNHFTCRKDHELKCGIDGTLTGVTAIGNTYSSNIPDGRLNMLSGIRCDDSVNTPLMLDGESIALTKPLPQLGKSEIGSFGWIEDDGDIRLALMTPDGWKTVRLE